MSIQIFLRHFLILSDYWSSIYTQIYFICSRNGSRCIETDFLCLAKGIVILAMEPGCLGTDFLCLAKSFAILAMAPGCLGTSCLCPAEDFAVLAMTVGRLKMVLPVLAPAYYDLAMPPDLLSGALCLFSHQLPMFL